MLAARHRARLAMQDGNPESRENVPARILRNPKVKRKLFVDDEGTENTEEKRGLNDNQTKEFMEENRKHLEEARIKYNFNFETDSPEPGNYLWEKVNKDENYENDATQHIESCKSEEINEEAKDSNEND